MMSMSYPARTAFFLFLDLAAVQVGNLSLYRFDGFHLIHRLNVHTHNERAFHIQKISQQTVIQLRCENLQKETAPYFLPIRNCLPVRNSKELGAIKSFVDRPEGASQSHSN